MPVVAKRARWNPAPATCPAPPPARRRHLPGAATCLKLRRDDVAFTLIVTRPLEPCR